MSAAWPLQVAMVEALEADAGLAALGATVHDLDPPEGTPLPYVVVGTSGEASRGTFHRRGFAAADQLHVYHAGPGRGGALAIYDRIRDVLSGELAPVGYRVLTRRVALLLVMQEPAGVVHAVVAFEPLLQEA